jgi:predicted nucleic acid-binding Zn ribbon protein
MSDDALTECQECGAPAERVLHPVAIHFKGSGFHNTDYGKKKTGANGSSSDSSDPKPSEPKSSDSKPSSSDSKSPAKAE